MSLRVPAVCSDPPTDVVLPQASIIERENHHRCVAQRFRASARATPILKPPVLRKRRAWSRRKASPYSEVRNRPACTAKSCICPLPTPRGEGDSKKACAGQTLTSPSSKPRGAACGKDFSDQGLNVSQDNLGPARGHIQLAAHPVEGTMQAGLGVRASQRLILGS